jgi:hypothetical protein
VGVQVAGQAAGPDGAAEADRQVLGGTGFVEVDRGQDLQLGGLAIEGCQAGIGGIAGSVP